MKTCYSKVEIIQDILTVINIIITATAVILEKQNLTHISDILYRVSQIELIIILIILVLKKNKED